MTKEYMATFDTEKAKQGLNLQEIAILKQFLRTIVATGVLVVLSITALKAQRGYDFLLNVKNQLDMPETSTIILQAEKEVWIIAKKDEKLLFLQQKTGQAEKVFEIGFNADNESNTIVVYEYKNENAIQSRAAFGDEERDVLDMAEVAFKKKKRPTFQL